MMNPNETFLSEYCVWDGEQAELGWDRHPQLHGHVRDAAPLQSPPYQHVDGHVGVAAPLQSPPSQHVDGHAGDAAPHQSSPYQHVDRLDGFVGERAPLQSPPLHRIYECTSYTVMNV